MNLELIDRTLEVAENPGLDTFDPRFNDITTLVQNGDYLDAAAQAEAVLTENIHDIRIIGYFLYGAFLEQGVGLMAAIFQCLTHLLEENWEAVGPAQKRGRHAQTSLNWLLKMLLKKLQYEEEKKGDDWNRWIDQVSSDDVQAALDAGDELRRSLGMRLEEAASPVLDGLMKVNDWLNVFQQVVYREPEPEQEDVEEEAGETREGKQYEEISTTSPPLPSIDAISIEGSYHLKILLRKLEVFERLIIEEKFPMAALVADDINNIIAHFDPKIYFPKLFSKFSLLFALNIGELASFQEYKGGVQWQALKELYKVDLDSFVKFKPEGLSLDSSGRNDMTDEQHEDDSEL